MKEFNVIVTFTEGPCGLRVLATNPESAVEFVFAMFGRQFPRELIEVQSASGIIIP